MKVSPPRVKSALVEEDEIHDPSLCDETNTSISPGTNVSPSNNTSNVQETYSASKNAPSLHNLGNTCYVNSVLQVLYRTPGFTELVSNLSIEIGLVNQAKASFKEDRSYVEQIEPVSDTQCWALVLNLNELFVNMNLVERAGGSVKSALKPVDLLEDIRLLNPMFSDNLQHDAHELLRCLLSYIDDATSRLAFCRQDILSSSAIQLANNRVPCLDFVHKTRASTASCSDFSSRKNFSLRGNACCNNNDWKHSPSDHPYVSHANSDKQEEPDINIPSNDACNRTLRSRRTITYKLCEPNNTLSKLTRSFSCPEVKVSLKRLNFSHLLLSRSLNGLSQVTTNRFSQRSLVRFSRSSSETKHTDGLLSFDNFVISVGHFPCWNSHASPLTTWSPPFGCIPDNVAMDKNEKEADLESLGHTKSAFAKLSAINQLEALDRGRDCRVEVAHIDHSIRRDQSANNESFRCSMKGLCRMHRYSEFPALCVKDMFGGEMSMRTRCLSCCHVASRSEMYEDIALPISQSTPQGASGFDWIFSALDEVEKLQGENRYHCDLCDQLADVERSVHYITAPRVLTLHLKRFASQSSHVTKTVDNVSVPLVLPCIERDCRLSCDTSPSHWYELYGVVAHSGRLASSGHYLSYVRDRNADQSRSAEEDAIKTTSPTFAAIKTAATVRVSLRPKLSHRFPGCIGKSSASVNQRLAVQLTAISRANRSMRRRWLECDDECISILTEAQFEAKLKNAGKMTPYLLFYEKRISRQPNEFATN